jgi:phosphoacetylglucosamine mutase
MNELLARHAPPTKKMSYGTAGFRDEWTKLHAIFLRMGILASVRSSAMQGRCVGIMITASHNLEKDNGIKMVDIDGGMLSQDWEPYAESIANFQTVEEVINFVAELKKTFGCEDSPILGTVIVGRDTRPHSKELFDCACDGITAMGATCFDVGEVTTPQLHFIVQKANEKLSKGMPVASFDSHEALQEYYLTLSKGFFELQQSSPHRRVTDVIVDGAYGVGGLAITSLVEIFNSTFPQPSCSPLAVDLRNKVGQGSVNDGCGAEVVQKGQIPPHGVSSSSDSSKLMCSYDGDADRIVFHTFGPSSWSLLDGDKIATLISTFLIGEIRAAGLFDTNHSPASIAFRMGVVQTAYANGASTAFLKSQGIEVAMAKTGVKFLHHVALE